MQTVVTSDIQQFVCCVLASFTVDSHSLLLVRNPIGLCPLIRATVLTRPSLNIVSVRIRVVFTFNVFG